MTQVAILWHMHQPFYEDLVTREHILPWVRLHGLKDYYGMAALMREFPDVRLTFNLVPSLLVQLEAFAEGRARDRFLDVSLAPAAELTAADAAFMIQHFFHAHRHRMIEVYPRYAELLARRGGSDPDAAQARALVPRYTVDDLRDLQVWQKLAWIDPGYLEGDSRIRALIEKGRDFTEDDKAVLHLVEIEILNKVIPEYRAAAERGQVELSTSPFYHPILPLLCDSDIYMRTHPDARRPRQRFRHPEDAADQLARAVQCHERLFGHRPAGVWPSEGSVSDEMVPLAARAGFRWMATDELILARSLGVEMTRDAGERLIEPERLYTAYQVEASGARIACAFRDHALSDRIGFAYSGWPAEAAADDFVSRLAEAGRQYAARTGGAEALIPIILDGENAWEHFDGGGRPFLRALYGRLSSHPELRTVTMGEGCAAGGPTLPGIFPGSWIDANFYIWIGHADDQRAWSQLAEARDALEAARLARPKGHAEAIGPEDPIAKAGEEVLVAEGSDWFWWYGDDHSSAHDLEFDDLFRRHLRNVYKLLQKPIPDELFVSNISTSAYPGGAAAPTQPAGLLSPTIDGDETSYFEWLGAGAFEVRDVSGAMHQADRPPAVLTLVQFGFDRTRLYVRLDGSRPLAEVLAGGAECSLKFIRPEGVRLSVRAEHGRVSWRYETTGGDRAVNEPLSAGGVEAAAGRVLELAVPLADLGLAAGDRVAFFVAVSDAAGSELEHHPPHRPIEVDVPDERFAARNWTV
jgi:alpha-amylase/alpha-mannosidase (GH57 family)